jgi:hypothetical protein
MIMLVINIVGLNILRKPTLKASGIIFWVHIAAHKFIALGFYIVNQNTPIGWKLMFIRETSNKVRFISTPITQN